MGKEVIGMKNMVEENKSFVNEMIKSLEKVKESVNFFVQNVDDLGYDDVEDMNDKIKELAGWNQKIWGNIIEKDSLYSLQRILGDMKDVVQVRQKGDTPNCYEILVNGEVFWDDLGYNTAKHTLMSLSIGYGLKGKK